MSKPKSTPEQLRELYNLRHGEGAAEELTRMPERYTLREAADKLGVTFQRVSKMYQDMTGKSWEEAKWEAVLRERS